MVFLFFKFNVANLLTKAFTSGGIRSKHVHLFMYTCTLAGIFFFHEAFTHF